MNETREVDVFWTVQNGKRWSISLTEDDAWSSLESLYVYDEDPHGWSVEHTREIVPVALGEVIHGEGESIELDEDANELSPRSYQSVHVFWSCPHCGNQHNTGLYEDSLEQTSPRPNPSIWFCENGKGIVLVRW